jgi:translation initiation factor IF-1
MMPIRAIDAKGYGCPGAAPERVLEIRHDRRYTGRVRVVPLMVDDGDVVQATVWESQDMKAAAEIAATVRRVVRDKGWPPMDRTAWFDEQNSLLEILEKKIYVRSGDVVALTPWPMGQEPPKPLRRRA